MSQAVEATDVEALVGSCFRLLRGWSATLATAESLTGGLLGATLTGVAGASAVYRGGVVAYAVPVKAELLGVPHELLERHGPVHEKTAEEMGRAARRACGATYALATTGVAGPEPHGDQPVGTAFVGCAGPAADQDRVVRLSLSGDRSRIRWESVLAALRLLHEGLSGA